MDGKDQSILKELAEAIRKLTERVLELERENAELHHLIGEMEKQIDAATVLARTGSPVIPDDERKVACDQAAKMIEHEKALQSLSKAFK